MYLQPLFWLVVWTVCLLISPEPSLYIVAGSAFAAALKIQPHGA